uniref:Nostrin n=1 Tax=Nomascus leucogenys TaxID=61853 RepID=A0A2I3HG79_NOMLE
APSPLSLCPKNLKEFSQNGENFCKQVTSVLQQSCVSSAWAWASEGMKSTADLHQKSVSPNLSLLFLNWNQQIKAKKKLMVSTKKHEALFQLVESSKQSVTEKEKRKLLNKLTKSTEKLEKEDENYYQKNMAGYSTRLKWENTLENCYQSILELEKERIQLLCNNLNQYSQHISLFGQTLTTCHTQIHCAISKIDIEKDMQALMEETAILSTENKSEFLLTDYFEEDPNSAMDKERRKSLLKPKLLRLQRDIEKASKDKEGLERMLKTYSSNSSFSDAKSQKDTAALMDENNLKLDLLEANSYKLSSMLAELEQRPQPSHPCSNSIFRWREKVTFKETVIRALSISAPGAAQLSSRLCKALYSFQARQDDELNLEKGDIVIIHEKKEEGWWFGSLNGKKGHFPAAYVEELPSNAGNTATKA